MWGERKPQIGGTHYGKCRQTDNRDKKIESQRGGRISKEERQEEDSAKQN